MSTRQYRDERSARFARHAIEIASNRDSTRPAHELYDRLVAEYRRDVLAPHPQDDEQIMATIRKACGV